MRPEETYRLCSVVVYDLETSRMRRQWPALGRSATAKKKKKKKIYNNGCNKINEREMGRYM